MFMKIKYLSYFSIKKIIRTMNINLFLIIVLIIGLSGLMISSEFSNTIKKGNKILITIETESNTLCSNIINNIKKELNIMECILDINVKDNLYIKTTKYSNINKIKKILKKYNYNYPVKYFYCEGYLSPKLEKIIKTITKYLFTVLTIVIQIIFIIITLKKINMENKDYAFLKCIGYRVTDIMIVVFTHMFLILIAAFIFSTILSTISISTIAHYIKNYMNISLHFNTVMQQIFILSIEYVVLFNIIILRIKKINWLDLD